MNIQEALTQAKAGKFVARDPENASFNDAIFYIPDFQITAAMNEDIPSPTELTFVKIDAGFYRKVSRQDGYFGIEKYEPSTDDALAVDWFVFQV